MSPAGSSRGRIFVEGPNNDIYTVLLWISTVAILLAVILLALEYYVEYGGKTSPVGSLFDQTRSWITASAGEWTQTVNSETFSTGSELI